MTTAQYLDGFIIGFTLFMFALFILLSIIHLIASSIQETKQLKKDHDSRVERLFYNHHPSRRKEIMTHYEEDFRRLGLIK